jgi:hypothetical protein
MDSLMTLLSLPENNQSSDRLLVVQLVALRDVLRIVSSHTIPVYRQDILTLFLLY